MEGAGDSPPRLLPPSHFLLHPPGLRTLGAELEAERRRGQALGAELEAERRRGQALGAELEAERRRGQALGAELEAERGRVRVLEAELAAARGRGQALGAEPGGEQPQEEPQRLLQAQLSALGHILTLQERELSRELPPPGVPLGVPPPRLQALLGCWREKVFTLLVQLRVQEEAQRGLRAQVGALGAALAAGRRRVTLLELSLRQGTAQQRDTQRLELEVTRQRGRADAAEEALGALGRAAASLAEVVTAREAEVTAATQTLGTLGTRLRRAGGHLHLLRELVASDRARWQREPTGDNPVAKVTAPNTRQLPVTGHRVTRDRVTPPGRAALLSLVTQLQALGAAILGDTDDVITPADDIITPAPPPAGARTSPPHGERHQFHPVWPSLAPRYPGDTPPPPQARLQ